MSLKLKEEMNHLPLLDAWIDDDDDSDLNIGLETFTKNIKKVIKIIGFFLCLLTRYNERRAHNMLAFMLDPRLKVLRVISSFIGHKHRVSIAKRYNKKSLFPMLLKSYHHLHPLFEVERPFVHRIDEVNNFNIFEMVVNTSDLTKELVNRRLLMF